MIKTAYAVAGAPTQAVADLKERLAAPALLLYFASSSFDPDELASRMQGAFPDAVVFGCTTAGEFVDDKALSNSVTAMAFDAEEVEKVALQIVDLTDPDGVKKAARAFADAFGDSLLDLDPARHVGVVLTDGLSGKEETVMDQLANQSNIAFIGGSAGDDLKFKSTRIFAEGKAWSGVSVLVLFKTSRPFAFIKTQSFKPLDKVLVATKVDEAKRVVMEFDGRPAAEAYAEAIGVAPENVAEQFMKRPLGLMIDDEPYVRSPQRIEDGHMHFYCAVKEGMELHLLEGGDIVADTAAAVAKAFDGDEAAAIVNFNCILRTLELQSEGRLEEYGRVFKAPAIGFSTYGEAFLGHINQTATMLVFKK